MLQPISLSAFSPTKAKAFDPYRLSSSPSQPRGQYLKFRTTHHENLRYLKAIGIIDPRTKPIKLPHPDAVSQIITTVDFFKSKGFLDTDFSRLAYLCPQLFSPNFDITSIEPVFQFLTREVNASEEDARVMVIKCPALLFSNVEYCLRPTLDYLTQLGVSKLNVPSTANAHLLNIRVDKLNARVEFLRDLGFSHEEAARTCARLPAIFGFGIDSNLRPKVDYLVKDMGRSLEELKEFPRYLAFSLEKKIIPRHLHLKERNVKIKLDRMLLWSDERFYAKWK
ncbi:hypothetical protein Tsubulata_028948 [Turnera subulata]|uniref:Uncharacterized protein n=1 Tax=Turnera subulata TaxID=218843 RepID=A0A9Q0JKV0_9ROSI|nr:hypothetical protein Tsubulata_028948 [Turnera subulata]